MARRGKSRTTRRSTSRSVGAKVIFSQGAPQDSLLWLLLGLGALVAVAYLL
ncbi:MAG: hypothetical protein J4451_01780 [DPANN group archaeon]|nr:hypothetical protein [DPANN group archaeon]